MAVSSLSEFFLSLGSLNTGAALFLVKNGVFASLARNSSSGSHEKLGSCNTAFVALSTEQEAMLKVAAKSYFGIEFISGSFV